MQFLPFLPFSYLPQTPLGNQFKINVEIHGMKVRMVRIEFDGEGVFKLFLPPLEFIYFI